MALASNGLTLGRRQAQAGDFPAAVESFQAVLKEDPGNIEARISLGHVLSYLGRYADAEQAFAQAIELEPGRHEFHIALGQLYAHLGRRRDAIACFRRVIEGRPSDEDAWAGIVNLASHPVAAATRPETGPLDDTARAYRDRHRLILVDRLHTLLDDGEKFVVLDGGARGVTADPRWLPVPDSRLRTYAFEPDEDECQRLIDEAQRAGTDTRFFPVGLWSHDGTLTFECNQTGGGSSFLHQNRHVTDRWKFENPQQAVAAPDIFFPVQELPIAVMSLESWAHQNDVPGIDFVKLNVQGGELEILRGAGPLVDRWLGLLVEVAFVESYDRRPFFAEIDCFLRGRGFAFFDLLAHHYVGRAAAPVVAQHLNSTRPGLGQLVSSWGQLIEGHALYLRDPIADSAPYSPSRTIKLICIAEIFGQVEYAFELLSWLAAHCRDRSDVVLADRLEAITKEAHAEYLRLM